MATGFEGKTRCFFLTCGDDKDRTFSTICRLQGWKNVVDMSNLKSPCLVQSTLTITGTPADTFIDMRNWHKGVVFVNGFNIGRYWHVGPQQTLYIPAPLLRTGENTVPEMLR